MAYSQRVLHWFGLWFVDLLSCGGRGGCHVVRLLQSNTVVVHADGVQSDSVTDTAAELHAAGLVQKPAATTAPCCPTLPTPQSWAPLQAPLQANLTFQGGSCNVVASSQLSVLHTAHKGCHTPQTPPTAASQLQSCYTTTAVPQHCAPPSTGLGNQNCQACASHTANGWCAARPLAPHHSPSPRLKWVGRLIYRHRAARPPTQTEG